MQFGLKESLIGRKKYSSIHTHCFPHWKCTCVTYWPLHLSVCCQHLHQKQLLFMVLCHLLRFGFLFSALAQPGKSASVTSGPLKSLFHDSLLQLQIKGSIKKSTESMWLIICSQSSNIISFFIDWFNYIMGNMHRDSRLSDTIIIVDMGGQTLARIT